MSTLPAHIPSTSHSNPAAIPPREASAGQNAQIAQSTTVVVNLGTRPTSIPHSLENAFGRKHWTFLLVVGVLVLPALVLGLLGASAGLLFECCSPNSKVVVSIERESMVRDQFVMNCTVLNVTAKCVDSFYYCGSTTYYTNVCKVKKCASSIRIEDDRFPQFVNTTLETNRLFSTIELTSINLGKGTCYMNETEWYLNNLNNPFSNNSTLISGVISSNVTLSVKPIINLDEVDRLLALQTSLKGGGIACIVLCCLAIVLTVFIWSCLIFCKRKEV